MRVLPDVLAPDLEVVFCGLATNECAALRGHHHAGPGDIFWRLLHEAGFTPRVLAPDEDDTVVGYGLGLTDVPPSPRRDGYDVAGLVAAAERLRPRWVAITGKGAAAVVARDLGHPVPGLGPVPWQVGPARAYVLPSASTANRRRDYDGRPTRLDWWADLGARVRAEVPVPP